MVILFPTLLFVGITSAQLTTSFWGVPVAVGTDKIGWEGSIVAVEGARTTVVVGYDSGTDLDALGFGDGTE
jgi:hypothetical protein